MDLCAREILDSRGWPTLEVELTTALGSFRSSVPSGASRGMHEAHELRDQDPQRYHGQGVQKAVGVVHDLIAPTFRGQAVTSQDLLDQRLIGLDATPQRTRLGANTLLGVSLALCRAAAAARGLPLYRYISTLEESPMPALPVPFFNVLNGGRHAGNPLAFQEFMIAPVGAHDFAEAVRMGSEVYHHLRAILRHRLGPEAVHVGDEGGFAPFLREAFEAFELLQEAIVVAGYTNQIVLAVDCAASEFYDASTQRYDLSFKTSSPGTQTRTAERLIQDYLHWSRRYPTLRSLEDPLDENHPKHWAQLRAMLPTRVQLVGDDLTVTQVGRLQQAIDLRAADVLLLKLNQVGTLTEGLEAWKMAKQAGWRVMVSHRSGETEDTFLADLAVGLGVGQFKGGAPCRGERTGKLNRLLRLEEELKKEGVGLGYNPERWGVEG